MPYLLRTPTIVSPLVKDCKPLDSMLGYPSMMIQIDERYTFDSDTHTHFIDGREATGVSTISGKVLAKPALIPWATKMMAEHISANCKWVKQDVPDGNDGYYEVSEAELKVAKSAYNKVRDKAATHGTDAHALVEKYINVCLTEGHEGLPQAVSPHNEEYASIQKFIEWSWGNVETFLFSERHVYAPDPIFVAGIVDFGYISKNGQRFIADFKTSSGIYGIDYFLQCAGYRILAESMGDEVYDGGTIVRIGKDGSFETTTRQGPLWEQDRACFLAALKLYRAQRAFEIASKEHGKG